MMADTKYVEIKLDNTEQPYPETREQQSIQEKWRFADARIFQKGSDGSLVSRYQKTGCTSQKEIIICQKNNKQKGIGKSTLFGYKKINYADQKMKEAYRNINKMLGGN